MSEKNNSPQDELDLAALLAIETERKDSVVPEPKAPEIIQQPSPTPVVEEVKVTDLIAPDDAASNMINMIDAIQSIVLTGVLTAKQYFHFTKEDREVIKIASKKSIADRSAYETFLLDRKKEVFKKYQEKADKLEFTEKEINRLKKPAKALVVQKNIQVSPGLAFGVMIADILTDRAIDILLDD